MLIRALSLRIPIVLLSLLASAACEVDFVPRAEAREEWKKSYTVTADGELTIENAIGKIVVKPGSGNTVEVVATRIAKAGSDEAAKKLLADHKIEETVTGSSVRLSTRAALGSFGRGQTQVDYEVRAPAGLTLKLTTTIGTVDVSNWSGSVEMSATNGSLTGTGLTGEVEANTTNGKVDLNLAALHDEGVNVETTNGRVVIAVPKDAKGRVIARVTNGAVEVEGLNVEPSSSNTRRRYEATINGGGSPTINVETTNGAITVRGS